MSGYCDAYRAANLLKMASRRAFEWIEMFEGLDIFLDLKYQELLWIELLLG